MLMSVQNLNEKLDMVSELFREEHEGVMGKLKLKI